MAGERGCSTLTLFLLFRSQVLCFLPPTANFPYKHSNAIPKYHLGTGALNLRTPSLKNPAQRIWAATATEQLSERYLKESNSFRPLAESNCVAKIYSRSYKALSNKGGVILHSAALEDKVLFADSETALSASFLALMEDELGLSGAAGHSSSQWAAITITPPASSGEEWATRFERACGETVRISRSNPDDSPPFDSTSEGGHGRDTLCEIHFCEQEQKSAVAEWLRGMVEGMDPTGARRLLAAAESPVAQAVFAALPWGAQRGCVQALGRLEARLAMRWYPETRPARANPLLRVAVRELLSPAECEAVVAEAEEEAAARGWTTSRHKTHATTDLPIARLPRFSRHWNDTVSARVKAAVGEEFGFRPDEVEPVDVFVVKYSGQGQRSLSVHRDGALLTFSLLLNRPEDFSGGGLYLERAGRVYRPAQGVAVVHSGKVRHGGYPIDSGARYILVGFCLVRSAQLREELEGWRWGDPAWYLSSAVVTDSEILSRVYRPPPLADTPTSAAGADAGQTTTPAPAAAPPAPPPPPAALSPPEAESTAAAAAAAAA
eukprot:CAMPEP_0172172698 /NCGR_PEP_ID=MMETSP1050-20130122/12598_1 /TAXON_ID=233186 /ORGANISM="Cryptomonas curvata, Strain CCAP979/52" /LENGTH=548 /DNA_ID=CAMNT_0012844281 /DNA_START=61 /DNA_END=1703 /DNA_ORIENTATION=+